MRVRSIVKYRKGREGRAKFICEIFPHITSADSLLNVGCGENHLKNLLGDSIVGVDIAGSPDYVIDLEEEVLAQFPDHSFDVVVCTEVLEHVSNFHALLDDLLRVAKKEVIISLPNCTSVDRLITMARTHRTGKHYGLPPIPKQDRHKWFFSYEEILEFFTQYTKDRALPDAQFILHHNLTLTSGINPLYFLRRFGVLLLHKIGRSQNTCESIYILLRLPVA